MANESFEDACAPALVSPEGSALNLNSIAPGGCNSIPFSTSRSGGGCFDAAAPLPVPSKILEMPDIYEQCCKCPDSRGAVLREDAQGQRQSDSSRAALDARDNYGDYGGTASDKRTCIERRDVTITNGGRSDVVSAAMPQCGESLHDLLRRMHTNPSLSEKQLENEVKALIKYNKAYGNDLGDGTTLGDKEVYLTSVKFHDAQGRLTQITSPTGRITEFKYDNNELSGIKITDSKGAIVEDLQKAGTTWQCHDGTRAKSVKVDTSGNVVVEQANGDKLAHLTRGDDVLSDGRPCTATTTRNGQETVTYNFTYNESGEATVKARFSPDAQNVDLDPLENSVWFNRLQSAGINQRFRKK